VEYYKVGELTLGASDFAYRDPAVEYVSKVVVSRGDGCAVWTIDLNGSLISGHWSTGAQLLIATPEVIYTFGISPGAASQPVYKEYIDGKWVQKNVPEGHDSSRQSGTLNTLCARDSVKVSLLC
jgi:hypothetical protein